MQDRLAILKEALSAGTPPTDLFPKPFAPDMAMDAAIWRFLKAWKDAGELGPDHAVLFRQVLRWGANNTTLGRNVGEEFHSMLEKCGVAIDATGKATAVPFRPTWIREDTLPADGIDNAPVKRETNPRIPAEHYLQSLKKQCGPNQTAHFDSWKSLAQKEGAWLTITAKPGSTNLVVLPTGMGKSQCFHLLPIFSGGLTVVVVPTVALAIDQYRSAKEVFQELKHVNPLFYAANDPSIHPGHVIDKIKQKQTRLIFTSPEACVTGKLRTILEKTAKEGWLENLVVDEAHLVSSWGMYFRVDFQLLSGLRRKWMGLSGNRLKTFLYTATLTPEQKNDVLELFSESDSETREFLFQSLRPEQAYYDCAFKNDNEQDTATDDCIWHLPRPAIVYTTEVKAAKTLYGRLKEELGLRRLGLFTGDTSSGDRRNFLDQWRDDELDVMVATSAFGLGVDKQDVRTVVHCCMPEDLNRYYQEVGRSGRDGYLAVSVLIPTSKDQNTAKGMAPKLLDAELIQKRWSTMWGEKNEIDNEKYLWEVSANSIRPGLLGDRTYSENLRWNKRLLLQLSRANKIEITDMIFEYSDELPEPREHMTLRIREGFNPASNQIGEAVKTQRTQEGNRNKEGLQYLQQHLEAKKCISRILKKMYGGATLRSCGGCRWCRNEKRSVLPAPRYEYDRTETHIKHAIVEGCSRLHSAKPRSFKKLIRNIVRRGGIRRFACDSKDRDELLELFKGALKRQELYRLDAIENGEHFSLLQPEHLAIIHTRKPHHSLIDVTGATQITHLLCGGIDFEDVRYPVAGLDAQLGHFHSADAWFIDMETA